METVESNWRACLAAHFYEDWECCLKIFDLESIDDLVGCSGDGG